jgi:hypothetical protein
MIPLDKAKLQQVVDEMRPLMEQAYTEVAANLAQGMTVEEVVTDLAQLEMLSFYEMVDANGTEYALSIIFLSSAVISLIAGEKRMVHGGN